MFQLSRANSRQHQTLALNSLIMNNIFNLANCFNQFGAFNLRSGFRHHPFFVCVLLLAVFLQVSLTELNAFGLENLNPSQWFVCFVFALLSALIAPLTGQQSRQRNAGQTGAPAGIGKSPSSGPFGTGQQPSARHHHDHHDPRYYGEQLHHQPKGHLATETPNRGRNSQLHQRMSSKSPPAGRRPTGKRTSSATHDKFAASAGLSADG